MRLSIFSIINVHTLSKKFYPFLYRKYTMKIGQDLLDSKFYEYWMDSWNYAKFYFMDLCFVDHFRIDYLTMITLSFER